MSAPGEQGGSSSFNITPDVEFSELLTLLPIFHPSSHEHGSVENPREFTTPIGKAKLHGPLLTEHDENTFISMLRLRSKRLTHVSCDSREASPSTSLEGNGWLAKHCVVCTCDDVNAEMERIGNRLNSTSAIESIKRLSALQLELELHTRDRYLDLVSTGCMTPIVEVQWQLHRRNVALIYQFPSVIQQWLGIEYAHHINNSCTD